MKYCAVIKADLFELIRKEWWDSGQSGTVTWSEYQPELTARQERYAQLVDQEGISLEGICAEAAALIEEQGLILPEDRPKMLVLLIDYAPAAQYGQLLDQIV